MKDGFSGKPKKELWKVGNGGFSLRKSVLSLGDQIESTKKEPSGIHGIRSVSLGPHVGNCNNSSIVKISTCGDIFWSIYVPLVFGKDEFNVADPKTAAHYSFETLLRYLHESVTKGIGR